MGFHTCGPNEAMVVSGYLLLFCKMYFLPASFSYVFSFCLVFLYSGLNCVALLVVVSRTILKCQ